MRRSSTGEPDGQSAPAGRDDLPESLEVQDSGQQPAAPSLSYRELFVIFLKAGLHFGGGLGILAALEAELVTRRRLITPREFLTLYGLGRIVPSGTSTALTVGYGYKFKGLPGTFVALTAMMLPGFIITISLTVAYVYLRSGPVLSLAAVTILPAAVALILLSALSLGRAVFRLSIDPVLAILAFVGVFVFGLNPALLLVAGGIVGIIVFRIGRRPAA